MRSCGGAVGAAAAAKAARGGGASALSTTLGACAALGQPSSCNERQHAVREAVRGAGSRCLPPCSQLGSGGGKDDTGQQAAPAYEPTTVLDWRANHLLHRPCLELPFL